MMKINHYKWAVIGAGPAGIACIGNLIDADVPANEIAWIDPSFSVGDFGTLWKNVSSNTSVKLFLDFFNECQSFNFNKAPEFPINKLNSKETCLLNYAAEPLYWITRELQKQVVAYVDNVLNISMKNGCWDLKMKSGKSVYAKNIILATGSEPNSRSMGNVEEIPLKIALDKNKLKIAIEGKKKVAVIGSSHSAVILIRDLLDLGVEKVVNFYLDPLRYAVFFDDWILFDNTGLKGKAAEWARENLQGNFPKGLTRHISTPDSLKQHFDDADSVIYATGFIRRAIPIDGLKKEFDYSPNTGIIAPGLFGVGIAFPEKTMDRYGHQELSVGLWKFMMYLKKNMLLWHQYGL